MRGTVDFYGLLGIFSDPLFGAPFRATLVFVYHRLGDLLRIGREAFTSRPHWFYTGILRGPKRFSSKTFRFAPNSVHSSGVRKAYSAEHRESLQSTKTRTSSIKTQTDSLSP